MKKIINNIIIATLFITCISCQQKSKNLENNTAEQIINTIDEIQAIGKVIPQNEISIIAANTSGIVEKVLIQEGDSVIENQILALIKNSNAALDIEEGKAQLSNLEEVNMALLNEIKQAEVKYKELEETYKISKKLYNQNAETKEKLNIDKSNYLQQKYLIKNIKQKYNAQLITEQEQKIRNKKTSNVNSNYQIRAKASGIIIDLNLKTGQNVNTNQDYGQIVDINNPIIEAEVDELFANDVKIGQQVYIYSVSRTDTLAVGQVIYVSPILSNKSILYETANEGNDRRIRKIKIKPNKLITQLTINAKVNCSIKIK